jgi:ligand-binding sensor domain-containing protein
VWFSDGTRLDRWEAGRLSPVSIPPGVPHDHISRLYGDSTGRLWVAFARGTLNVIDEHGPWRVLDAADGFPNVIRSIHDIYEDREHVVWVAHTQGLSRFESGRRWTCNWVE